MMTEWQISAKNKLGQDCIYSAELAEDLRALHNIDIEMLFASIYGTTFFIEKKTILPQDSFFDRVVLEFTLTTNDERDEPVKWTIFPRAVPA